VRWAVGLSSAAIRTLASIYSAHRGTYRVLYEIDGPTHSVTVIRVAGCAETYRPR